MPGEPLGAFLGEVLPTEQDNPNTRDIDLLPISEILTRINEADQTVPEAVKCAIPEIARVVERVVSAFHNGGRLFYIGAGTSGRLGVLDASECPPTFGVSADLVQGLIAGGDTALRNAVEGAEDSAEAGQAAVHEANVKAEDVFVGISASGGALFIISAVQEAQKRGAFTGAITCVPQSPLAQAADMAMVAQVGPEVLAGSSRLKAGTAQKLILNMITTGAMIAWGKTYRNLMVDLKPTNQKLRLRAIRLVSVLSDCDKTQAETLLEASQWQVKTAVVMARFQDDAEAARVRLAKAGGKLRAVLESEHR